MTRKCPLSLITYFNKFFITPALKPDPVPCNIHRNIPRFCSQCFNLYSLVVLMEPHGMFLIRNSTSEVWSPPDEPRAPNSDSTNTANICHQLEKFVYL